MKYNPFQSFFPVPPPYKAADGQVFYPEDGISIRLGIAAKIAAGSMGGPLADPAGGAVDLKQIAKWSLALADELILQHNIPPTKPT